MPRTGDLDAYDLQIEIIVRDRRTLIESTIAEILEYQAKYPQTAEDLRAEFEENSAHAISWHFVDILPPGCETLRLSICECKLGE